MAQIDGSPFPAAARGAASPRRAGQPDLRRTLRRSFRTGGEPLDRAWRRRRTPAAPARARCSTSRARWTRYSRALAHVRARRARADRRWEAFCFGTRLTRVTRALDGSDPDEALARAAAEVVDWDGGTRIGDSLKRFLDRYGHGGLARGAVVVLCSDGLEVGDPELLARADGAALTARAPVVWLNPLKETPAYEPLARGMHAALPYVDVFASGHNLASLEALGEQLAKL